MANKCADSVIDKSRNAPPTGISVNMWEKFQRLRKRNQAARGDPIDSQVEEVKSSKRNKQNRGKTINGEKSDREKVSENDDDLAKASSRCDGDDSVCTEKSSVTEWSQVKSYIDINKHLQDIDRGRHKPQNDLEEKISDAIKLGDVDTAEKLSDRLAMGEFGKRIADAFEAKKFSEKKKIEDTRAKERRKKKLNWGFEHKQRWETKGNM